jgi:hypothetical protein
MSYKKRHVFFSSHIFTSLLVKIKCNICSFISDIESYVHFHFKFIFVGIVHFDFKFIFLIRVYHPNLSLDYYIMIAFGSTCGGLLSAINWTPNQTARFWTDSPQRFCPYYQYTVRQKRPFGHVREKLDHFLGPVWHSCCLLKKQLI